MAAAVIEALFIRKAFLWLRLLPLRVIFPILTIREYIMIGIYN